MPQPPEVPTFELRADDLFAMFALFAYQGKVRAVRLGRDYQHYVDGVVLEFETWRREQSGLVVIPSVPQEPHG